ncbi:hypothetical protein [Xylella fastidiosa]|uniref:hypothetical protein n=1 Tax=Xylella fastidiosa TaxID=2371 RepID=UPI003CCFBC5D
MKTHTVLLFSLIFSGPALAQPETSATTPHTNATSMSSLDLTPPELPIQYHADPTSNTVPSGTYYGDTSGIPAAITDKKTLAWSVNTLAKVNYPAQSVPAWAIPTVGATVIGKQPTSTPAKPITTMQAPLTGSESVSRLVKVKAHITTPHGSTDPILRGSCSCRNERHTTIHDAALQSGNQQRI